MALASVVVGAHGVMVEVHPDPEHALSDGPQSLHFKEFEKLQKQIRAMEGFMKTLREQG
jgi:3-deoxy-7-phosphoheptulonate synthase